LKPIKLPVHCERIRILWPKNKKTIGTNPNKVQLFNLIISKVRTMARPSSPNTVNFLRILSDPQRIILLSAGEGNLSKGFENVLSLYQYAHNIGFRPSMDYSSLGIVADKQQPQLRETSKGQ